MARIIRVRVRAAMAAQTLEQGQVPVRAGARPYGYRLGNAGPHPNKEHAAWGDGRTAWNQIPGPRRW
jgi:hypothetical protein